MSDLYEKLASKLGNREVAENSKSTVFSEREWKYCITCGRKPVDLATLNKNGEILCSIHNHHDHIDEHLWDVYDQVNNDATWTLEGGRLGPDNAGWYAWLHSLCDLMVRFQETEICSFCNEAEGAAKKIVGTDKAFSFSPLEMTQFIEAKEPGPVNILEDKAREIWEIQKDGVAYRKKLADRLVQLALDGKIGMVDIPLQLKAAHGESE